MVVLLFFHFIIQFYVETQHNQVIFKDLGNYPIQWCHIKDIHFLITNHMKLNYSVIPLRNIENMFMTMHWHWFLFEQFGAFQTIFLIISYKLRHNCTNIFWHQLLCLWWQVKFTVRSLAYGVLYRLENYSPLYTKIIEYSETILVNLEDTAVSSNKLPIRQTIIFYSMSLTRFKYVIKHDPLC